jgi:hypothetical protein
MRDIPRFFYHVVACIIKMLRPGGVKSIAAENLILRQQLIVVKRTRKRALTTDSHQISFPTVWLYYRFNLSHRDIEDLLAERGITVSREAIRLWCIKFIS